MAPGRTYKLPIFKPPAPVQQPVPEKKRDPIPELDALLKGFSGEIGPGLISTVVAGRDGLSIAGVSNDAQFNQTDAAARFSILMNLAGKVSAKLGTGRVEDNLTTTDKAYVITRYIGDGRYFWGVALLRTASLGFVRMLMNEFADLIWNTIPR